MWRKLREKDYYIQNKSNGLFCYVLLFFFFSSVLFYNLSSVCSCYACAKEEEEHERAQQKSHWGPSGCLQRGETLVTDSNTTLRTGQSLWPSLL